MLVSNAIQLGGCKSSIFNDMDSTVGHQEVGCDELGAVDEDGAVVDRDRKAHAAHGSQHGAIHEGRAISDGATDDYKRYWRVVYSILRIHADHDIQESRQGPPGSNCQLQIRYLGRQRC